MKTREHTGCARIKNGSILITSTGRMINHLAMLFDTNTGEELRHIQSLKRVLRLPRDSYSEKTMSLKGQAVLSPIFIFALGIIRM